MKTHSSFYDINGHKFTDLNNTLGVIYFRINEYNEKLQKVRKRAENVNPLRPKRRGKQ